MPRTQTTTLLLSLATLCVPAFAQGTNPAVRDSYSYSSSALNYVQGQVTLDGQPVSTNPNTAPRPLHTGDSLATTNGTADVMLAPGSLLRLGQGTDVQMVANDAGRHEVRLDNGRANVAVNAVPEHSLLLIDLPNGQTQILKRGLYTFDTATDTMRVFNGEADAFPGAETDTGVKPLKVKDGHELTFNEGRAKPASFDREMDTDLLPWSGAGEARAVVADGAVNQNAGYASAGYGYGAAGFYGDGYGYGYPLYAGFGYPYGSYGYPYGFYGSPFGLGLGFGYYGGGFYGRGFGGYGGGFSGGGFHGGGFGGGGFHGGGGFGGGRR